LEDHDDNHDLLSITIGDDSKEIRARSEKALYVVLIMVLDYFSYLSVVSSQIGYLYFFVHQILFLLIAIIGWYFLFSNNDLS